MNLWWFATIYQGIKGWCSWAPKSRI